MADFFFFTQLDSPQTQGQVQAYGPVPSEPLEYRVNNQFFVPIDAPAIAIVDGIPLVQQCDSNPNCVNIVLFPIKNPDFNFPNIKLFIYRGLRKDALFDTNGNIPQADSSWKSNNILTLIHDLQNKINQDAGTTEVPKTENLGYHYSDSNDIDNFKASTEFIETIIFLNDGLQLPLVKAGCQLGKFIGGSSSGTAAGIQIVLDRVGYEPTLELARKNDDIVTVSSLGATPTEIETFQHWHEKEQILTYIDSAAFYGCAKANNLKIKAYQNSADINGTRIDAANVVSLFYNKNCCYLDIRNDFNYSFNYYKNFRNNITLGFEQTGTEDFLETSLDYYTNWPLLRIINQTVPTSQSNSKIRLGLPINDAANYTSRYFLRSYSLPFTEKEESKYLQELNSNDPSDKIRINFNENIIIKSWINNEDYLGANYFLFKYSKVQLNDGSTDIIKRKGPYEFTFPTNLKLLIGDDNLSLEDGDFKVFLYSSENGPICLKNLFDGNSTFYTQYLGIAQDKNNTSFFSFADRIGHDSGKLLKYPFSIINTGRYNNSVFVDEFDYDPLNEELGFLAALPLRVTGSNLELKKIKHEFKGQEEEFLYFLNNEPADNNRFHVDAKKLHVITMSNEEYIDLLALRNQEFDSDYKVFVHVENDTGSLQDYEGYALGSTTLKLIGLNFNTLGDNVETKEIEVVSSVDMEKSELNFYVNKT